MPLNEKIAGNQLELMSNDPLQTQSRLSREKPPGDSFGASWWPGAESNLRHKDFQL